MRRVVVDGWWGSGKGGVIFLLNGSPDCAVNPVQDGWFERIASFNEKDFGRRLTYNNLAEGSVYSKRHTRLRDFARNGFPLFVSSKDKRTLEFPFNFEEFKERFANQIPNCKTNEALFSAYIEAFCCAARWLPPKPRFFITLGINAPETLGLWSRHQTQCIFLLRKVSDICSSLDRNDGVNVRLIKHITKVIPDIYQTQSLARRISMKDPERFLSIDFFELYGDSNGATDKISRFLKIPSLDISKSCVLRNSVSDISGDYFSRQFDVSSLSQKMISAAGFSVYLSKRLFNIFRHARK